MRKIYKVLIVALAVVISIVNVGCLPTPSSSNTSAPSAPSADEQTAADALDTVARNIFLYIVEDNNINMNFYVSHPEDFGVDRPAPPTLGQFSVACIEKEMAFFDAQSDLLDEIDRDDLSSGDQLTYDVLESFCADSDEGSEYIYFSESLQPTSGINTQLPVLLAEYHFNEKADLNDYIAVLKSVPGYFDELVRFEQEKSDRGLFMSDRTADHVIKQCEDFVQNPEKNLLLAIFDENIDAIDWLSEEEKTDYKEANRDGVLNYVVPAYEKLSESLAALKGTGIPAGGLAQYPNGAEYYAELLKGKVGFSLTPDEAEELLSEKYEKYMDEIQSVTGGNDAIWDEMDNLEYPETEPDVILEYLQAAIAKEFPDLGSVEYTVKKVDASLEDSSSPAFYLAPAIDDMRNNLIYMNEKSIANDANDIFTILAHEGFPGHLYQINYFMKTDPDPVRNLLPYTGYSEGWATYVEMESFLLAGFREDLATVEKAESALMLILYEMIDIGVNYHGWDIEQTGEVLEYFGYPSSSAEVIFDAVADEPAMYAPYTFGFLAFDAMREKAETALGDQFEAKEFHQFILETGPADFDLLNEYEDRWIAEKTSGDMKFKIREFLDYFKSNE
ncbi:Tat pathway signal protein [Clostridia bacterium]|nr:Tat pathway signal protein [Clostridia bacterium]